MSKQRNRRYRVEKPEPPEISDDIRPTICQLETRLEFLYGKVDDWRSREFDEERDIAVNRIIELQLHYEILAGNFYQSTYERLKREGAKDIKKRRY